jgi:hypothetical protein
MATCMIACGQGDWPRTSSATPREQHADALGVDIAEGRGLQLVAQAMAIEPETQLGRARLKPGEVPIQHRQTDRGIEHHRLDEIEPAFLSAQANIPPIAR